MISRCCGPATRGSASPRWPRLLPLGHARSIPDGYLDSQLRRIPAGGLGDPDELAAAVVFLASPAASHITGTTLIVHGGLTAL